MYELSMAECQRRRALLQGIRAEMETESTTFVCDCSERADEERPGLIQRIHAGDPEALDALLGFYSGCIDSWARDIYGDPVYEAVFKAEIVSQLTLEREILDSDGFNYRLHLLSAEIADDHLRHVEEAIEARVEPDCIEQG